jgi:carbon-monoxide dehydrogenase large subunit
VAWIGERLLRSEDENLLTGKGRFVADFAEPEMLHAIVFRSPVASAVLRAIDTSAALAVEGVIGILTGEDAARDGLGGIPWEVCPPGFESKARHIGDPDVAPPQPVLALHELRYVGEPVALVVATTVAAATVAAEQIKLTIEERAPVTRLPAHALCAWSAPEGAVFSAGVGDDPVSVQRLIGSAPHVVEIKTEIPRLAAAPLETRGYLASYDAQSGEWRVVSSAGKPHSVRDTIALHVLHVDPARIKVTAPDIGGGFGAKNVAHAEMALVLWAARKLGRPVRWICSRGESFLSDMQGRGHLIHARLALDSEGKFLALAYRSLVDLGAWLAPRAIVPAVSGLKVLSGPYRIGAVAGRVDALHTNNVPTCPYRGAGIPETAFAVERLVDMAASRLKMDPATLRARNLVAAHDMPYATRTGTTLHSVDFAGLLAAARKLSNWDAPQPASSRAGIMRGRGMAFTMEAYGASFDEAAELVAHENGRVEILIGTKSGGQGHLTSYAQIAADALGLPPATFDIVQGDTARIARGNGTGASRSITTGGSALLRTAQLLVEDARTIASQLMQAPRDDLVYSAGAFTIPNGSGASVSLAEIAATQPQQKLHVTSDFRPNGFSFPHGCHVAEVDVDAATGIVELVSYKAVQDAGVVINPMIAQGQLAGGIAQGVGAALMERLVCDSDTGQPLTASFLDYCLPRAADFTSIEIELRGVPCASNPLGAKAIGEAGAVTAPVAVINALVNALAPLGVTHIELPATPERVWSAILNAEGTGTGVG